MKTREASVRFDGEYFLVEEIENVLSCLGGYLLYPQGIEIREFDRTRYDIKFSIKTKIPLLEIGPGDIFANSENQKKNREKCADTYHERKSLKQKLEKAKSAMTYVFEDIGHHLNEIKTAPVFPCSVWAKFLADALKDLEK